MGIVLNDQRKEESLRVQDSLNIKYVLLRTQAQIAEAKTLFTQDKVTSLSDLTEINLVKSDDFSLSLDKIAQEQADIGAALKKLYDMVRQLQHSSEFSSSSLNDSFRIGLLKDISESGMAFASKEGLKPNDLVVAEIDMKEPEIVKIVCLVKILRVSDEEKNSHILHGIIDSIPQSCLEKLRAYINYRLRQNNQA